MSLPVEARGAEDPTTVVLVRGAGVAGWMWRSQVESLADFPCLLVDLPDHGDNRGTPFGTIDECAADVLRLVEARAHEGKAHPGGEGGLVQHLRGGGASAGGGPGDGVAS